MADQDLYDDEFNTVLSLVQECGKLILNAIYNNKAVETKSCDVDLVTFTDKQIEGNLMAGLSQRFPHHSFIGEESGKETLELTDNPTWIIDPIDGTMNFVHGFPHCCISIALFVNKIPQIGIIYNPAMDQMFSARKGLGAYYNSKLVHVSTETKLSKALIMAEAGTSREPEKMLTVLANYNKLIPLIHGVRTLGSAALNMAMVALGGADANYEFGIHIWDIAAGQILVEEAGGVCIDPSGGSFDIMSRRVLCAGSHELAQELASQLIQYYPPRDDAPVEKE